MKAILNYYSLNLFTNLFVLTFPLSISFYNLLVYLDFYICAPSYNPIDSFYVTSNHFYNEKLHFYCYFD